MKFSVLMSIYYKENPDFFDRAMRSIWDEQTLKPSEIVLVEDGELISELYEKILKWKQKLNDILVSVKIQNNVGLAEALNVGLEHCKYELIARMDTDDICLNYRFKKQVSMFIKDKKLQVCGGLVCEFENDENQTLDIRKVPQTQEQILKYARYRNPINHPSVMYKKSAILKAGGYKKMIYFEDFYLFVRLLQNGAKFYNIQEVLLKYRANDDMLKRRSGLKYIKYEYTFIKKIYNIGFIKKSEFIISFFTKIPTRVLPFWAFKFLYRMLRKF